MANWTPIEWPSEWRDAAKLELLENTPVNFLLLDASSDFTSIRAAAKARGIETGDKGTLPDGVRIVKGEWPGVRLSPNGDDSVSAGPTGEPWVNTNGWRVAVEKALLPGETWISAMPKKNALLSPAGIRMAVADTAAAGGRWIVSILDPLAQSIADGNSGAIGIWKEAVTSAAFFARQADWTKWTPQGTIGVMSNFAGKNAVFAHEVVNLIGRAGSHYRAIPIGRAPLVLEGLRAVLYVDTESPTAESRESILNFVNAGGTLITTPNWGKAVGTPRPQTRPGYHSFAHGKGRIEMAEARSSDPYAVANDAVVIVSHRYDLARLWNCGAHGSYCSLSPDGKRMLAQFLIYSDQAATESTAWVAGQYKSAKLYTIETSPRPIDMIHRVGGAEIQLPSIRQYAAIELEKA